MFSKLRWIFVVGIRIRRRFAAHVRAATTAVFFVCLSSALGCVPSKIRCVLNGRLWTGGAPSTDTASEAATFHVEVKCYFWGVLLGCFDVKFLRAGRAVQIQPAQLQARAGDGDRARAVVVETANAAGGPR